MPKGDEAEVGLSKLAHAIRRSTAAYIAMQLTPPDGTLADWESNADHVARWIGGHAAEAEQEATEKPAGSLGVSWHERDSG